LFWAVYIFGIYCGKTAKGLCMKKSKILIVFLIGLLLMSGLVLIGCAEWINESQCYGTKRGCNEVYTGKRSREDYDKNHHGKCDSIFCPRNNDHSKDCNCL